MVVLVIVLSAARDGGDGGDGCGGGGGGGFVLGGRCAWPAVVLGEGEGRGKPR